MSFKINPNRADTEPEIVGLILENSPPALPATSTTYGTIIGYVDSEEDSSPDYFGGNPPPTFGRNAAIGYDSLGLITPSSTQAHKNNAFGFQSLKSFVSGSNNIAIGDNSMRDAVSGSFNIALGTSALINNSGSGNIGIGGETLIDNEANYNIAIGDVSLYNNSSGSGNTAIGRFSLVDLTTGANNTAIGKDAGEYLTTGSNNTLVGSGATPSSPSVNHEITLGNSYIETLRCQVTSITSLSDARDKKNIENLTIGLDFVNKLNPVKFDWNMRDGGKIDIPDTGFIAQDLIEIEDESGIADYLKLTFRNNPDKLEASYGRLIPILVKAIQDLSKEIDYLKEKINA